jgi:hypothetical protein
MVVVLTRSSVCVGFPCAKVQAYLSLVAGALLSYNVVLPSVRVVW